MANAKDIRTRQERLRGRTPTATTTTPAQQDPRTHRASTNVIPVVIRSTQAEVLAGDPIQVQRVRYSDTPPVADAIEGVGPLQTAYPFWGLTAANFAVYAWGPFNPIGAAAFVLLAMEDRGSLVLIKPLHPSGTVLTTDDPISGCSFG